MRYASYHVPLPDSAVEEHPDDERHRGAQRRLSPKGQNAGLAPERGRRAGAPLWADRDGADQAAKDRRLPKTGEGHQRAEARGLMSDCRAIERIEISRKLWPFQIPHEAGRDRLADLAGHSQAEKVSS